MAYKRRVLEGKFVKFKLVLVGRDEDRVRTWYFKDGIFCTKEQFLKF